MKRFVVILMAGLVFAGCKERKAANAFEDNAFLQKEQAFQTVLEDPSIPLDSVANTALDYAEALKLIAAYGPERRFRLRALDKAAEASESVKGLADRAASLRDFELIDKMVWEFSVVQNLWLTKKTKGDDKLSYITRELPITLYYGAPFQKTDYIYMRYKNGTNPSEEELLIRFPFNAKSHPSLLFFRHADNERGYGDAEEECEIGPFEFWKIDEAPYSRVCRCGKEVISKMLEYDAMVILYTSDREPKGSYNGHDSVLVELAGFHEAYQQLLTQ